jgi:hypothetical protein
MDRQTPPYSAPSTPIMRKGALPLVSTPKSTSSVTFTPTLNIPENLTQELIEKVPELKRWQEDLLILTGFNDNSTLHWRPSWFAQSGYPTRFWTLHNPPGVVTELLPMKELGRPVTTRRMRRYGDVPAPYIKSWDHWYRYCEMYGVPVDFLCEEQIRLMRLGLSKAGSVELHGTSLSLFILSYSLIPPYRATNPPTLPRAPSPWSWRLHLEPGYVPQPSAQISPNQ